jgi:hypothetical protein
MNSASTNFSIPNEISTSMSVSQFNTFRWARKNPDGSFLISYNNNLNIAIGQASPCLVATELTSWYPNLHAALTCPALLNDLTSSYEMKMRFGTGDKVIRRSYINVGSNIDMREIVRDLLPFPTIGPYTIISHADWESNTHLQYLYEDEWRLIQVGEKGVEIECIIQ